MLCGLHGIVAELMYAENFYIALYDRARDSLRFIYYVDSVDTEVPAVDRDFPLFEFEQRLTGHLIRGGKALMGTTDELRDQVSGPLYIYGADSIDWLGVPMMREGQVHGALVVQSYVDGVRFNATDKALLGFVAEHVLTALERKQGQAELERRVTQRTQQLAEANSTLCEKVEGLERAEHLQTTLYRIAALANNDDSSERFYRQIHAAVGELLYAESFYIALLTEDRAGLEFPYYQDAHDPLHPARPLGRGLTEYVLRQGCTKVVDANQFAHLVEQGEIEPELASGQATRSGPGTVCWLGAPLRAADGVMGVVALQSCDPTHAYDTRDAELLTFVAHQIASSVLRRQHAERLRKMNSDLEERVEVRTRELSEQIRVREEVEGRLKHQVMHDPLTGLPNRLYMRDRIEQAIRRYRSQPERPFGLLYLDIDRFKVVNDSLGHLAGDVLLKEVSNRLQHCVRAPDAVARLSGDEFAVLLEDAQQPQSAIQVAQRILAALQEPMQIAGRELRAFVSIGIAISAARHTSTDILFQDADTALYSAKSAGRRQFVLFDESLQRSECDVLGMEQELRAALQHGQFEAYFQPLVRLEDRRLVGFEALVRWNHPTRGVLLPGDFLPVAEECGLIDAIDWQMYRNACEAGRALVADGRYLTINVSPRHFQGNDLHTRLLDVAAATGFDPASLRVEVTEGTLLGDPESVANQLMRLREAGIGAALDDFGTGYCSLGYVHRFPLRMLKIDRSFIEPLGKGKSPRSSAVVTAILALANSLGLDVLAEGIETETQENALRAMGCNYGQGYLYGKPQPASHWLSQDRKRAA
jgi:diguanylate cyclase (GGDEF)-like protein